MSSQKGIAHAILISLAGLGVITYLILSNHLPLNSDLFSVLRRDDNTHASLQKHPLDAYYNLYGDPWSLKKAANSSGIMAMLTSACYRYGPKTQLTVSPTEEVEFLSKSNPGIVLEECAIISDNISKGIFGGTTHAVIRDLATKLKQKNPPVKFIGYYSFADYTFNQAGQNQIATNSKNSSGQMDDYWERMFVHVKGTPYAQMSEDNRLTFSKNGTCPTLPNGAPNPNYEKLPGRFIMNVPDTNYQNFITDAVVAAMIDLGMGGVLSDLVYTNLVPGRICEAQIPDDVKLKWATGQIQLHEKLKSKMNSQMNNNPLLFVNVSMDDGFYKELTQNGRADGIMLEDPMNRSMQINESHLRTEPVVPFVPGTERYEKLKSVLTHMNSINKYVLITINSNINGTNYLTTRQSWEDTFVNYYLAAYLNIFQSPKQMLVYHNPVPLEGNAAEGAAFKSAAFFKEWDITLGNPTSGSEKVADGIYLRKFSNAYVYLNTTYNSYSILTGSGLYDVNGTEINKGIVPAKSGTIFMTRSELDKLNGTTATPTPAPAAPNIIASKSYSVCLPELGNKPRNHFEWQATPGVVQYRVWRSPSFPSGGSQVTTNPAWNDDAVTEGSSYDYSIEAMLSNSGGNGIQGSGISIKTKICPQPTPTPAPASPPDPASECTNRGGTCLNNLNQSATGATCTNITSQNYLGGTNLGCPAVRPYCMSGCIPPALIGNPVTGGPNFTEYIAQCNNTKPRNRIIWSEVAGATSYKIFRSENNKPATKIAENPYVGLNDETNIISGGKYVYSIEAVTPSGSKTGNSTSMYARFCP